MIPLPVEVSNGWVSGWGVAFWRASLTGGFYILALWVLCRALPRMPASLRAWLWWLACLKLLIGLLPVSPLSLPILPPPPSVSSASRDPSAETVFSVERLEGRGMDLGVTPSTLSSASQASDPPPLPSPLWILFVAWTLGAGVSAGRIVVLLRVTRQWVAGSHPLADERLQEWVESQASRLRLKRLPNLRVTEKISVPLVTGTFRPVLLLPSRATESFTPEELEMALAHELAHLRRRDLWMALVPALAHALFFFHPLAWWAYREWKLSAEAACDADALRITGAPTTEYGHLLMKLVRSQRETHPLAALGVNGDFYMMDGRLKMLRHRATLHRRRWTVGMGILLVAGALCLVPWRVVAQAGGDDHRDPEAVALLEQVDEAYRTLRSFSADLETKVTGSSTPPAVHARVLFQSSGQSRLEIHGKDFKLVAVSNGEKSYALDTRKPNEYKVKNAASDLKKLIAMLFTPGEGDSAGMTSALALFAGAPLLEDRTIRLRMGPDTTFDGVPVRTIVGVQKMESVPETHFTYLVGKKDRLLRQIRMTLANGKGDYVETIRNVKSNARLSPALFVFAPPPGAKPVRVPLEMKVRRFGQRKEVTLPPLQPVNGVFHADAPPMIPLRTVAGHVLTPDGSGVEGATVHWMSRGQGTGQFYLSETVKTGKGGAFHFPQPERLTKNFPIGTLLVAEKGWGLTFTDVRADDDRIRIVLAPATDLKASFRDEGGRPVPNLRARVEIIAQTVEPVGRGHAGGTRIFRLPETWKDRYACTTDASGSCAVSGLPLGRKITFELPDAPYVRLSWQNDSIELSRSPLTVAEPLVLTPEAVIRGRLALPDGKPVPGVTVAAVNKVPEGPGGMGKTDRNGVFVIRQVPSGVYTVSASLRETPLEKEWVSMPREEVRAVAGGVTEDLILPLTPGAVVTGKVTASTGEPISGVHLSADVASVQGQWFTKTGSDGSFRMRVPEGKLRLWINQSLPGFLPIQDEETHRWNEEYERRLHIRHGEVKRVDLTMIRD